MDSIQIKENNNEQKINKKEKQEINIYNYRKRNNKIIKYINNGDLNKIIYLHNQNYIIYNYNIILELTIKSQYYSSDIRKYIYENHPITFVENDNSIYKIIVNNDIDVIKYLISKNIKFNYYALKLAVKFEKFDILKLIVESGIDINDNGDDNLLYYTQQNLEIFDYLVLHGADINKHISHSYFPTILYHAVYDKNINLIQYLLSHGVKFSGDNGEIELTINTYIKKFYYEIFELLALYGANINFKNGYVLKNIIKFEKLHIIKKVINLGADINIDKFEMCKIIINTDDYDKIEYLLPLIKDFNFSNVYYYIHMLEIYNIKTILFLKSFGIKIIYRDLSYFTDRWKDLFANNNDIIYLDNVYLLYKVYEYPDFDYSDFCKYFVNDRLCEIKLLNIVNQY